MNLTEHQEKTFNAALNSTAPIVRFEGAGGTGKTTTINHTINTSRRDITLTATTNKALSHYDRLGCTIHSYLGYTMVEGTLRRKKNASVLFTDILIVDESSMLPRQLLRTIEEAVKEGAIRKVILVGDPVQLQIDQFIDLNKYPVFELKEQMRQQHDLALSRNLFSLRDLIDTKGVPKKLEYDDLSVTRYEDHADFVRAYKESEYRNYILAYRNNTVKTYNKRIVKDLHKKDNDYNEGDVLVSLGILYDEKGELLLRNREEFIVETAEEKEHYYIINNNIKIPKTKAWLNEQIDKYKFNDWKKYYKIKEQYVFAHHSYAGTVHSAQGATYDEVFIDVADFNVPNDPLDQTLLRLMYVSLSRAKNKAHVYVGSERKWDEFKK